MTFAGRRGFDELFVCDSEEGKGSEIAQVVRTLYVNGPLGILRCAFGRAV